MERKEVYALIKKYNLEDEVVKKYGTNYTRTTTDKLVQVVWDYDCTLVEPSLKEAKKSLDEEIEKVSKDAKEVTVKFNAVTNEVENPYEAACLAFLGILDDCGLLDNLLDKLDE